MTHIHTRSDDFPGIEAQSVLECDPFWTQLCVAPEMVWSVYISSLRFYATRNDFWLANTPSFVWLVNIRTLYGRNFTVTWLKNPTNNR